MEEVRRILLELADSLRSRATDLLRTVDAATELDLLQARARFSILIDGSQPAITGDGRLELRAARHPLLLDAVRRHLGEETPRRGADGDAATTIVPVDVLLIPPVKVLVITGPNTGGKTVALKTAGLLPLMAQSGLLLPAADGTQVPVFRSVFADIGDEQSIAESLSTFSGHIANIVAMDRALSLPSLVLLDEAGAGTDPVEGGALAMAMIDHFRRRGAMVVATTHYDALKSYAATTDGVTPAGFGFDPTTFAPTYRLNYGAPGSSLALEIATRLGLPAAIIEKAREHRTDREAQLAEHLAKVERDIQALEHERRLAARERESLEQATAKLQARDQELKNREETFKRRLDERIEERMRGARREIDAVLEQLKSRTDAMAADARRTARLVPTGQSGAARADARAAVDAIGERLRSQSGDGDPAGAAAANVIDKRPAVGDRVRVGGLGLEGIVQALHDREAEIDVRGKRLRARVDELKVLAAGPRDDRSAEGARQRRTAAAQRLGDRAQRHRLPRRGSPVAHREVPRPGDARRGPQRPAHSRLRHRPAAARDRRVSPVAPARDQRRGGATGARWRRRHRRGVEGVTVALFPPSFIDDLKSLADIVQVVQERVPLKRSGSSWKGLCPFHGEKTPSFHVYDKGFFKCFGCSVGGDVIKFVELYEKVTFPEAVRQLASRFGLTVPEPEDGEAGCRGPARSRGGAPGPRDCRGMVSRAAGEPRRRGGPAPALDPRHLRGDRGDARGRLRPAVAGSVESAAGQGRIRRRLDPEDRSLRRT